MYSLVLKQNSEIIWRTWKNIQHSISDIDTQSQTLHYPCFEWNSTVRLQTTEMKLILNKKKYFNHCALHKTMNMSCSISEHLFFAMVFIISGRLGNVFKKGILCRKRKTQHFISSFNKLTNVNVSVFQLLSAGISKWFCITVLLL